MSRHSITVPMELEYDVAFLTFGGSLMGYLVSRDGLPLPQEGLSAESLELFRDIGLDHKGGINHGVVVVRDWLELPFSVEFSYYKPHKADREEWGEEWGEVELESIWLDSTDFLPFHNKCGTVQTYVEDAMRAHIDGLIDREDA